MGDLARALDQQGDAAVPLRRALFGTDDAVAAAERIEDLVSSSLDRIDAVHFVRSGVGLVVGLRLVNGRSVVAKAHRWNASRARLTAVQHVQSVLADRGLPVPRPVVAPAPLGDAVVAIEEYLPGRRADGHQPAVRRSVARGLADLITAAGAIDPVPDVGTHLLGPRADGPLWGEPHDLRFDFEATASGAEWIDELARRANAELVDADLPSTVAHLDWRVENLAFDGTDLVAIYDWDSVGLASEAVAVGQAAAVFSTDWRIGFPTLPSLNEMRAFVADYEERRGAPFTDLDRRVADAANLLLYAYSARCEHSDALLHPELAAPDGEGWRAWLRRRATETLW